MLEVELKYRISSHDRTLQGLRDLAATETGMVEQVDAYFAHPCRDFAETDEALRIRRVGERNCITYKGPKLDATTKTRREIELALPGSAPAADEFADLLVALGFRPVATVRKTRTTFALTWRGRSVEVALDEVDQLGAFVEIETSSPEPAPESELDSAREAITSLAARLGLAEGERRSYLEMLLE